MKKRTIKTYNVEETINLGYELGQTINKGCIILLSGDIGVGKTHFIKGIARALDIKEPITSPTFTLLKEYEGRLNLKHIDAYRLENISADSLALYDLIDDDNIVVIEWSNYLKNINGDIEIKITYIDETEREIEIIEYDNISA